MSANSRLLLVAAMATLSVLGLRGDDPKPVDAKKQEAEKKAALEAAAREKEIAAQVAAQQAAQAVAQQVAQQRQMLARQQLVLQQGRMVPNQRGGFGGGVTYPVPFESPSEIHLKLGPGEVEARLGDGSVMKLVLLADALDLETAYGKLSIPMSDIKKVECGLRIGEAEEKMIATAVADAGGSDPKKRVAARDVLVAFREKALPAVRRAAAAAAGNDTSPFLADVEARIKSALPDGFTEPSDRDKIVTADSTFVGRLVATEFKVHTYAFGDQMLKLAAVRSIRTRTADEAEDGPVLPWTGSLAQFAGQLGKTFRVRVTAQAGGGIYGTGTYTLDSYLPAVAIHAGVLKPGQTGIVKFKIHPSPQVYQGSTRNGISSNSYGYYSGGAYEILK